MKELKRPLNKLLVLCLVCYVGIACTDKANIQNPITGEIVVNPDFSSVSTQLAGNILDEYLGIKNALIEDNDSGARKSAKKLEALLSDSPELRAFQEELGHIVETGEVKHQRHHFQQLSTLVYSMISEVGGNNVTVYKQFCPMAFDGKGAFWLSDSEEVINPYFGEKMLNCGSVQEKLEIKL